jgi:hypothetical protein
MSGTITAESGEPLDEVQNPPGDGDRADIDKRTGANDFQSPHAVKPYRGVSA